MPADYWKSEKGFFNIFENMAHVQFNHRSFAYLTYTATTLLFFWSLKQPLPAIVKFGAGGTLFFVNYQLINGVFMILDAVPVHAGVQHQTNAVLTLSSFIFLMALVRKPNKHYMQKLMKNAANLKNAKSIKDTPAASTNIVNN